MTANTSEQSEAFDRAAAIIANSVRQGLMEAEAVLAADREARAQALSPQVVETLERFGDALTRLATFTEQLGARMNELTNAVTTLARARDTQPAPQATAPTPQLPALEPRFAPGGEGVDVTIGAVPGFQGLMDLQRALVKMTQVQSAAVRRYQDDEAAIQLVLSQAMSASAIVEGVAGATGRQLAIDEARPEALSLRLRFLAE
jgi:hypothetical protein